jgi:leucyl aminopeptidase (aminopeptidase T)
VSALEQAVVSVVERCLRVQAGETVLVVADPDSTAIGHAPLQAARAAGGDAVLMILPPNPRRGTEPPAPVAAAFAAADVFIAPCLPSLSHTSARKRACELGHRGATLPGVTADMLARLMGTDFDALAARCRAVAALLTAADDAHMTCPRGTACAWTCAAATASPTRATSPRRARSATCPAERASCRPRGAMARSRPPRSPPSASPPSRFC